MGCLVFQTLQWIITTCHIWLITDTLTATFTEETRNASSKGIFSRVYFHSFVTSGYRIIIVSNSWSLGHNDTAVRRDVSYCPEVASFNSRGFHTRAALNDECVCLWKPSLIELSECIRTASSVLLFSAQLLALMMLPLWKKLWTSNISVWWLQTSCIDGLDCPH